MAVSIIDRLTASIRTADQAIEHAQFLGDRNNWLEARRVMQDARDELSKPIQVSAAFDATLDAIVRDASEQLATRKLDGRTKEARAAKAATQ